jgi:hypothetical protein
MSCRKSTFHCLFFLVSFVQYFVILCGSMSYNLPQRYTKVITKVTKDFFNTPKRGEAGLRAISITNLDYLHVFLVGDLLTIMAF